MKKILMTGCGGMLGEAFYHHFEDSKKKLKEKIINILSKHYNKPLTDNEIKNYAWLDSTPGIEEFVKLITSNNFNKV